MKLNKKKYKNEKRAFKLMSYLNSMHVIKQFKGIESFGLGKRDNECFIIAFFKQGYSKLPMLYIEDEFLDIKIEKSCCLVLDYSVVTETI